MEFEIGRLGAAEGRRAGDFKLTLSPQVPRSVATSVSVIMYPVAATSHANLSRSVTEHEAWVGGKGRWCFAGVYNGCFAGDSEIGHCSLKFGTHE